MNDEALKAVFSGEDIDIVLGAVNELLDFLDDVAAATDNPKNALRLVKGFGFFKKRVQILGDLLF